MSRAGCTRRSQNLAADPMMQDRRNVQCFQGDHFEKLQVYIGIIYNDTLSWCPVAIRGGFSLHGQMKVGEKEERTAAGHREGFSEIIQFLQACHV